MISRAVDSFSSLRSRPWVQGLVVASFWALIALLVIARNAFDSRTHGGGGLYEGEVLQTFLEYGTWAVLTPLIFWMAARFQPGHYGWARALALYVLAGITASVAVDMVDHTLWNALVPDGPHRPVSVVFILSGFHFSGDFAIYLLILAAGFARVLLIRVQENEKKAAQLQAHLAEARLQTLRMQINPHFLFNTLHVISDNFEEDPSVARRMIARLSEILRYSFQETGAREVELAQELRFLDGYLDIQRFRFEDRLTVKQDIDPDVRHALVPNMLLQPLVENAIQHGVSQLEGPGYIELRAWREDDMLQITVRDNGPGLTDMGNNGYPKKSGGLGLRNTRERLEGLYGSSQRLSLQSPPEGGVVVHVSLPYHTRSDYAVVAASGE